MAKLHELEKYLNYQFSTGCYTGKDYLTFQRKYINYLRALCKERNWTLVNVGKNHYCFTTFIKTDYDLYVYISIPDVRFLKNEWYNHILIREAKDEKDYHGGRNHYTTLPELPRKVLSLTVPF